MVSISDEETVEVEQTPAADKPKAKPKAKRAPAKTKKVTVEIPADTVVDEDEDESGEGEAPPAAPVESPPAAEPPAGPAKVDMSNKDDPPKPVYAECEYCGKKVKKGGLGKHIANLAGDGIHPFKEELTVGQSDSGEETDDSDSSDFEVQPWMIALAVGILGLVILVAMIVLGKKDGGTDTTVNVNSAPPAPAASAPEPVEHNSEPAMVEDANGNQVPINVVRNGDGTFSLAP